jgi:hypothetical protein
VARVIDLAIAAMRARSPAVTDGMVSISTERMCTARDCERKHHARNLCRLHYQRSRPRVRSADPRGPMQSFDAPSRGPRPQRRHGTAWCYNAGCRLPECLAAERTARRRRYGYGGTRWS